MNNLELLSGHQPDKNLLSSIHILIWIEYEKQIFIAS